MSHLQDDSTGHARRVFAGLQPTVPIEPIATRDRSRLTRAGSVLLVGSVAAMTLNLTGPVTAAEARPQPKPKGTTTELGKTIRDAVTAANTAIKSTAAAVAKAAVPAAAPMGYTVQSGDTVSSIAGRYGLSTASVLALNGLSWSSLIFPGQSLKLTSSGTIAPVQAAPAADPSGRYTIVAGDTISGIAHRYGVSTLSVLSANGLGWSSIIYPGQTIAIPGLIGPGAPAPQEAAPVEVTPAPLAETYREDYVPVVATEPIVDPVVETPVVEVVVDAPTVEAAPAPAPAPVTGGTSYTIVSGDTISAIAARFGVSTQALLTANGLTSSTVIYAGRLLTIPAGGSATPSTPSAPASTGANVTPMNAEMRANAAAIVQVGRELGVPEYGLVIALAAAMQESTLRNLTWGDRDSVGLFQQRPSAGWGTVDQLTTPSYAARLFFGGPSNPNKGRTRGLLDIAGWQSMTVTQAAQRVQISAYPNAYAKWETSARAWLAEL